MRRPIESAVRSALLLITAALGVTSSPGWADPTATVRPVITRAWGASSNLQVWTFLDSNGNGFADAGEPPIGGFVACIDGGGLFLPLCLRTPATGSIEQPLSVGSYAVTLSERAGWALTTPVTATVDLKLDVQRHVVRFGVRKLGP